MSNNTINIPGYKSEVEYGSNFGYDYIVQATYHFTWGYEVAFYNRQLDDIGPANSNVAVWHIKQRRS